MNVKQYQISWESASVASGHGIVELTSEETAVVSGAGFWDSVDRVLERISDSVGRKLRSFCRASGDRPSSWCK